jgi:hypothetical protein
MIKFLDFLIRNAKYSVILYLGTQFGFILLLLLVDIYKAIFFAYFGFDCIQSYFQSWYMLFNLIIRFFLFLKNKIT